MNYHSKFYIRIKRSAAIILLLGLFMQPVSAQMYEEARDFLSTVIDGVVSEIKTRNAVYAEDTEKLYQLIDQRILSAIDMELFSKLALGTHWNSASTTQRQSFAKALRKTMIHSYGKSLLLLSKVEKIDYPLPQTTKAANYHVVKTMLFFVGGRAPISINYAMLSKEEKWVIFDLIMDGLSIGKQFRQNFDLEIKEKGLDALIMRLNQDAARL